MLGNQGVTSDRISTQGLGQDHPIASNDTEEGRARNRRIELNVTHK
jgi:outer membrane protein OmpA-like peptidoglycan-associated protein